MDLRGPQNPRVSWGGHLWGGHVPNHRQLESMGLQGVDEDANMPYCKALLCGGCNEGCRYNYCSNVYYLLIS